MEDNIEQQVSEFSRVYKFSAIKQAKEKDIEVKASADELVALAERLQLANISEFRVNAVIGAAEDPDTAHLVGVLNASLTLEGENEPREITSPIDVFFKPEAIFENLDLWDSDVDVEPYSDGTIDVGEVCVQYLSLELMAFVDWDEFDMDFEEVYSEPGESPFAQLEQLKKS